jgi:hypothetical protein
MPRKASSKKAVTKRKRVTPEMIEKMRGLRDEGVSHQDIAKRLGVTPMTARKYLKQEAPVVPVEKQEAPVEAPAEAPVGYSNTHERRAIPGVILLAAVLIIAAVAVASAGYYLMNRRSVPVVTYKTYTDDNYSIRFDYPDNWAFTSLGLADLQMEGLSPPAVAYFEADGSTGLQGEILLYIFNKADYENLVPGDLDNLTSYIAGLDNQFENNENYVVRSPPTVVAVDNHNGVRLMVTAPQSASENVRFELETVVKDNYFYGFEIVAPDDNYSSVYMPVFDHVIGSFSLLD